MEKIERKVELTNGFKLNLEELYPNVFLDKLDELVEGYNEMKAKLKAMSYYNELDRRLKRLEKIEVMRMLDNK